MKERLTHICQLAFPGSLESMLEHVTWVMDDVGRLPDGWAWERFEVHHEDAVEPHGYRFEHDDGASFVHSGDSGPCEPLYDAIERSALAILEMGFPDWVPSTHHHKPGDVRALTERCSTPLGITHTYIDDTSPHPTVLESQFPEFPDHVVHLSDGALFEWVGDLWELVEN